MLLNQPEEPELVDYIDSLSYVLGMLNMTDLSAQWLEGDKDGIKPKLMRIGREAEQPVMTPFRAMQWLENYKRSVNESTVYGRRNREVYRDFSAHLVSEFEKQVKIDTLEGGVYHQLRRPGEGPSPKAGDYVKFSIQRYHPTDFNVKYEQENFHEPVSIHNIKYPGLGRAITTMKEGECSFFFIPWYYAFQDESLITDKFEYVPLAVLVSLDEVIPMTGRKAGQYKVAELKCANPKAQNFTDRNPYYFRGQEYDFRYDTVKVKNVTDNSLQKVVTEIHPAEADWASMFKLLPTFFIPTDDRDDLPVFVMAQIVSPQGYEWGNFIFTVSTGGKMDYVGKIDLYVKELSNGLHGRDNFDAYSLKQFTQIVETPSGIEITFDPEVVYRDKQYENAVDENLRYIFSEGKLIYKDN